MKIAKALLFASIFLASPAAASLPEPVKDMIEAAIATGDKAKAEAVVEIARATNPNDGAEIDALWLSFQTEQAEIAAVEAAQDEQEIRSAGLFDNWGGQGQIGGFQSSGNTSSVGVSAALALERSGIDWTHKLRVAADYQRTNGVTSSEQFLASYEPQYQINDNLFAYGLAQFERDRFQGFSSRYSASGGLGYKILNGEKLQLSVKAGPAYRQTNFVGGGSSSSIGGLLGLDFDWQISDNIKLTQDTNAVAEGGGQAVVFLNSDNTSINVITGLEAGISDALTARLSYAIEYDSNPPAGAVSTDTLTRFTLVYGF